MTSISKDKAICSKDELLSEVLADKDKTSLIMERTGILFHQVADEFWPGNAAVLLQKLPDILRLSEVVGFLLHAAASEKTNNGGDVVDALETRDPKRARKLAVGCLFRPITSNESMDD